MREFEITNFKGIATDRNNWTKEQCQVCENFDLREVKGRLTSRAGYQRLYESPGNAGDLSSINILRMENIVMTAGGVETECTVLVGKGVLDRVSGSGASLASIKIGIFFIRPYYDGSSWVDAWLWLNECYLTTINNQGTSDPNFNLFELHGDFGQVDPFFAKFSIYNITGDTYSEIYNSQYIGDPITDIRIMASTALDRTTFVNNDTVLVMRNFIPYADLLEYGRTTGTNPITADSISFHKILTDLRIGFGGETDRLGLMIGYRKKEFQMDASNAMIGAGVTNVSIYDEIILAPYNALTEDLESSTFASGKTFHCMADVLSTGGPPEGRYFFKLTGLLDDFNEFLLPIQVYDSGNVETLGSTEDYMDTTATLERIDVRARFYWGLFNKRISKLRLYISGENSKTEATPQFPYFFVKEWNISDESGTDSSLTLNLYGFMVTAVINITSDIWEGKGSEIDDRLGYVNTLNYARGWDHAVAAKGFSFFANTYSDQRWDNLVLFSPHSGDGPPQYDVAVLSKFIDFENHDGNLTKGLGVLPNLDIGAFKANSFQRGNTIGQVSTDLFPGTGIDTKRSLVNLDRGIALCSQNDIYLTDGAQRKNLSAGGISDQFRDLSSKEFFFAVREEKEDAYRFWYSTTNQFLYAMNEWVKIDTFLQPQDFITSKDGTVWFLATAAVFNQTGFSDVNGIAAEQSIVLQWKSIEFDIAKMGEQMPANSRLYVLSVFMKYTTASNLSVLVYADGALFQTLTFSSSKTFDNLVLAHGCIGKVIEIEITGSVTTKTEIESIGFYWEPKKYREYV